MFRVLLLFAAFTAGSCRCPQFESDDQLADGWTCNWYCECQWVNPNVNFGCHDKWDDETECPYWAGVNGYGYDWCEENPKIKNPYTHIGLPRDWMAKNCAKSCGFCGVDPGYFICDLNKPKPLEASEDWQSLWSSNYPEDYGHSEDCNVKISSRAGSLVHLHLKDLHVEDRYDWVSVYDGADENAPLLAEYSGRYSDEDFYSSGPDMYITFSSDRVESKKGFHFQFKEISDPDQTSDPCEPNPCSNGGTCTSNGDAFTCTCPNGFGGETCSDGEKIFFILGTDKVQNKGAAKSFCKSKGAKLVVVEDETKFNNLIKWLDTQHGGGRTNNKNHWTDMTRQNNDVTLPNGDAGFAKWRPSQPGVPRAVLLSLTPQPEDSGYWTAGVSQGYIHPLCQSDKDPCADCGDHGTCNGGVCTCADGYTGDDCNTEGCKEGLRGFKDSGYRGCQTKTITGKTCQAWSSQSPHQHTRTPANYKSSGLEGNYCRNPDGSNTIWCYTTDRYQRWEYCDPLQF